MSKKTKYCCVRFKDSVEEEKFLHSEEYDETEWYMPEWLHIYYCPFCGTYVGGKGFGKPPVSKHILNDSQT